MYVLGIDGGGTKTAAVVADNTGMIYMKAFGGASNPNSLGTGEFERVLTSLLAELRRQDRAVFQKITICFAGMAGVGESGGEREMTALLEHLLPPKTQVVVRNDAYNALYAGTLGGSGIVQIAGTGAISFGINDAGYTARCGGWGYLFDDAGSGFYLGNEAFKAVFKAYDGRAAETALTAALLGHFNSSEVPALIRKVYGSGHPKANIAPLAPLVVSAAIQGDEAASSIMRAACGEMWQCILSCHRQLFNAEDVVDVVLAGGVFTQFQLFEEIFTDLMTGSSSKVNFRQPLLPPVGGAVIAGLQLGSYLTASAFVETFNSRMAEEVL